MVLGIMDDVIVACINGRDVLIELTSLGGGVCAVVDCADITAVGADVFAQWCVDNRVIGDSSVYRCGSLMITHERCVC